MAVLQTTSAADQVMLEGLVRSEPAAVRQVYDHVLPSIIYYVRDNGGTEADARDVFQDALLALYRRVRDGDFTLTCTLKSYLRVVCRNLWLKRLRKTGREASGLPEVLETVDVDPRMDERLENSEREALLWRHFDALEKGCRDILKRFFAGESMLQIAEQLDTSEGYIKKRKHVCKERLVAAVRADARFTELQA